MRTLGGGRPRAPGGLLFPVLPGAYLAIAAIALIELPYDVSGAFAIAPVLAAINAPLLLRACREEADPLVRRLISLGLVTACAVGIFRLYLTTWVYGVYGGLPDPARYHSEGAEQAARFWQGNLAPETPHLIGAESVDLFTGILYAITGTTLVGGYLCYSCIAFWGLYLCYRAFRTGLPNGNHRRYALLILFLPSSLFWSCGIGKEPLVMLGIGLALLGGARVLTGAGRPIVPLLSGLCVVGVIRPHIATLLIVALFTAVAFRRSPISGPLVPLTRSLTLAAILVAGIVATGPLTTLIGAEELTLETVDHQLDKTAQNYSNEGGSGFSAGVVRSPADFPAAVLTVLFRPFPWEAGSIVMLLAAAEGVFLAVLVASTWRRWSRVPWLLRVRPYLVLCLTALPMFVVVFSAFGNFGTLVRERLMLLPLVLVFLCLPQRSSRTRQDDQREPALSASAS